MKFDNVLVPIDGSTLSDVAVELAVHSAGVFATHLTFLFVVDVAACNRFGTVDPQMEVYKYRAEGKLALERAAKMADQAKIPYDLVLCEDIPWERITAMSKEHDMIIMTVTGKSGITQARIGSTAEKVIENCFCPVLTLKSGSSKIDSILLPVENKNMAAIDVAIETCKRINGTITVFSVEGKGYDAKQLVSDVAAKCRESGVNVLEEVGTGDVVEAIVGRSGKYDQIIMGTVRHGTLTRILNGSIAERVVTHASCPVTIVRDF